MAKTLFQPVSFALSDLLGDIERGRLALPELQRPFVWKKSEVRDLLDSMYRGFPVGYLMLWRAPEVDSKSIGDNEKQETPTEFIIDGQQRLTSLYAVMRGSEVTFKDFSSGKIHIAFRPRDETFAVAEATIEKNPEYLANITELWLGEDWEVIERFISRLRESNPDALADGEEKHLRNALSRLHGLEDFPFQAVQIGPEVKEDRVAEIFLRVNSGGTQLSQADFILTLLSVFRENDRRRLEGFALDASTMPPGNTPSAFNHLVNPSADQMLRVAILVAFHRGRLQSALAVLRGGGLDGTTTLGAEDRDKQLDELTCAIDETLDLTTWHEYMKVLMSAGFRRSKEISSANSVMLIYALYLLGRRFGLSHSALRTPIARFFFMATLTGRYTGAFESRITQDVQDFCDVTNGDEFLAKMRSAIDTSLTRDFWSIKLPDDLATSAARSPALFAYAASLCLLGARVPPFGSSSGGEEQKASIPIRDLFDPVVVTKKQPIERHHLFPRNYLENTGVSGPRNVNQIANLSYVEWPDNIEISATAPSEYWPKYAAQFTADDLFHHALPDGWSQMDYSDFLDARRKLIAEVIHAGYDTIGAAPIESDAKPTPSQAEAIEDAYLHPDKPFSNDLAIRRVVRNLRGGVFWYEQHMDRKALEILQDELTLEEIDRLRLMSGPANVTSKTKKAFDRFKMEMAKQGLPCEWRVIPPDAARALHARVIADDEQAFEVPPLNSVLAGTVDSIRSSEIPLEAFEAAWTNGGTEMADFTPSN